MPKSRKRIKKKIGKKNRIFENGGSEFHSSNQKSPLFRSLLELRLVDSVEVAIIPMLLGGGTPLFPDPAAKAKLKLVNYRIYEKTGTVWLEYRVV